MPGGVAHLCRGSLITMGKFTEAFFRRRRADSLTSEGMGGVTDGGSVGSHENEVTRGPKLARHMGPFDLTALGVGSTLGAGIYVRACVGCRAHAGRIA